ncbi:hypothetical protein ACFX15_035321 [Malus domestica]
MTRTCLYKRTYLLISRDSSCRGRVKVDPRFDSRFKEKSNQVSHGSSLQEDLGHSRTDFRLHNSLMEDVKQNIFRMVDRLEVKKRNKGHKWRET